MSKENNGKIVERKASIFEWSCPIEGCQVHITSLEREKVASYVKVHIQAHEIERVNGFNDIKDIIGG